MQIGLRDANQKFSQLMKAVRGGQEVLLTERGKPLAVLRLVRGTDETRSVIRRLESAGLLRPAEKERALPSWTPRSIRGTPVSRTIREERDER